MEIKEFIDEVIARRNKTITDEVFLLIQKDRELMKEYLYLVQDHGLQTVNQQIARRVVTEYGLISDNVRNYEPESVLISSYKDLI